MTDHPPLTGRDLLEAGWKPSPVMSTALEVAHALQQDKVEPAEIVRRLNQVKQAPVDFQDDLLLGRLAQHLLRQAELAQPSPSDIRAEPIPYRVWGDDFEQTTLAQLDNAAHLPISQAAALMPDGHPGYGLPIGGVLGTEHSVIPYGVGMDIACRMRMSIFNEAPDLLNAQRDRFRKALQFNTRFGLGGRNGEWHGAERRQHELLDDVRWQELGLLRRLHDKAVRQMGTSGTSNHFAEWAILTVLEDMPRLDRHASECRLSGVTRTWPMATKKGHF